MKKVSGNLFVSKVEIIGANCEVYTVWEKIDGYSITGTNTHTTFTTEDGVTYGELTSRALPSEIASLTSFSKERLERCHEWRDGLYEKAYDAIDEAYPEMVGKVYRDGGQVSHYPQR